MLKETFNRAINYIADTMAWKADPARAKDYINGQAISHYINPNVYYINNRTGDRKIVCGKYLHAPVDFEWLAQTKNKGIVVTPFSSTKTYTKKELSKRAAEISRTMNNPPGPE